MAETLILSALQVSDKDLKVLRSLLNLTAARAKARWEVSTAPGGEVTLVDVDTDDGAGLYANLTQNGNSKAVALTRQRGSSAPFVLHKPLRVAQLIRVLNELSVDTWSESGRRKWHPVIMVLDEAELPLAEHLRRHNWTRPVVLGGDSGQELFIDPGSGAWYSNASTQALATLLEHRLPAASARPLSSGELVARTEGLVRQNLAVLKWRAGLAQARGALHPDLASQASFMLPNVPPPALADTAYLRLARIMISRPVTFVELLDESGAEPEDAVEFLNACHACGFLLVHCAEPRTALG